MADFNDGATYVRNLTWEDPVSEGHTSATASMEIAHRALIGFKDVRCEVFIDGDRVVETDRRVWATALSWSEWSFEYPVDVSSGEHPLRFKFTYKKAGDLIGNVETEFTKEGETTDPPDPPDPTPGSYTLSLSAPSSVIAGEPFDVTCEACCEGESACPTGTYTLTLANRTLVDTDLLLQAGSCETASVSASGVTFDRTGTYTLEAAVGDARATQSLLVEAADEPPDDPEPPDPDPDPDPDPPDESMGLGPIVLGGFILLASQEDE